MATYDVAHIQEQGVDLIIIEVASSFGHRSNTDQNAITASLQVCANAAGLRGTVVPVWDAGGRMGFLAPRPYQPYFQSIGLLDVALMVNRTLTCG